jgi:hypothetical protein
MVQPKPNAINKKDKTAKGHLNAINKVDKESRSKPNEQVFTLPNLSDKFPPISWPNAPLNPTNVRSELI